jgi:hypothetical protein
LQQQVSQLFFINIYCFNMALLPPVRLDKKF